MGKQLNITLFAIMAMLMALFMQACDKKSVMENASKTKPSAEATNTGPVKAPANMPVIKAVWSFYTSWSLVAAAHDFNDFDEREGWLGTLEQAYGVDIVMLRQEYVESMTSYQSGNVDGVFITNTDALATAAGRKKTAGDATIAVFPTSWSDGADKILVENDIKTWKDLEGVPVRGAEFSVTQYLFWRACQINKCDYGKYKFENLQPDKGAPLFAADQEGFRAFGGWSPETFVVMDRRTDVKDLFNSSALDKYEIVDLLVMGQKALDTLAGKQAVKVLAEAMNRMADRVTDPAVRQKALQATSKRFNDLAPAKIDRALELTKLLPPKTKGDVLTSTEFFNNMSYVREFSEIHKLIEGEVPFGYSTGTGGCERMTLCFTTAYLY